MAPRFRVVRIVLGTYSRREGGRFFGVCPTQPQLTRPSDPQQRPSGGMAPMWQQHVPGPPTPELARAALPPEDEERVVGIKCAASPDAPNRHARPEGALIAQPVAEPSLRGSRPSTPPASPHRCLLLVQAIPAGQEGLGLRSPRAEAAPSRHLQVRGSGGRWLPEPAGWPPGVLPTLGVRLQLRGL